MNRHSPLVLRNCGCAIDSGPVDLVLSDRFIITDNSQSFIPGRVRQDQAALILACMTSDCPGNLCGCQALKFVLVKQGGEFPQVPPARLAIRLITYSHLSLGSYG